MKNSIYTIKELEEKYPEEWILGEVLEVNKFDEAVKLKMIVHSNDRDEVYDKLMDVPDGAHVATLFTGPPFPEGYAAAFYEVSD